MVSRRVATTHHQDLRVGVFQNGKRPFARLIGVQRDKRPACLEHTKNADK
jgi:hypothetical protein